MVIIHLNNCFHNGGDHNGLHFTPLHHPARQFNFHFLSQLPFSVSNPFSVSTSFSVSSSFSASSPMNSNGTMLTKKWSTASLPSPTLSYSNLLQHKQQTLHERTIENLHTVFRSHVLPPGQSTDSTSPSVTMSITTLKSLFPDHVQHSKRFCKALSNASVTTSSLNFTQFLNFFIAFHSKSHPKPHSHLFVHLDTRGDGTISPTSLQLVLSKNFNIPTTTDQANAMTDYVTSSLDSQFFTYEQFQTALPSMPL